MNGELGWKTFLTTFMKYNLRWTIRQYDLVKDAISECKMDYKDWTFIEELVK